MLDPVRIVQALFSTLFNQSAFDMEPRPLTCEYPKPQHQIQIQILTTPHHITEFRIETLLHTLSRRTETLKHPSAILSKASCSKNPYSKSAIPVAQNPTETCAPSMLNRKLANHKSRPKFDPEPHLRPYAPQLLSSNPKGALSQNTNEQVSLQYRLRLAEASRNFKHGGGLGLQGLGARYTREQTRAV